MTEMESPLEDYADELGFHFDNYFILTVTMEGNRDNKIIGILKEPYRRGTTDAKLTMLEITGFYGYHERHRRRESWQFLKSKEQKQSPLVLHGGF